MNRSEAELTEGNSPVQALTILSGRSAGYEDDNKSQPRMGLNTNTLNGKIQPLRGISVLSFRIPPSAGEKSSVRISTYNSSAPEGATCF